MEFENTFVVDAPMEEVWDLLLDVERIAPCMPGAQVLEQTGDDAYKVAVKVKLGPMTMNYKGDVEIVEKDAGSHVATMRAKAKEARGQGTASANMKMALRPAGHGTEASILTEMQMSGKAAAMGQGVIKDVAASLTDTFAQNVAKLVEGPAEAAPPPLQQEAPSLDAGQIAASVAAQRARDPRTVAFVVLLILLIGIAIGRRRH
jgi:carbon monoxide dehydrogenase subunit G